MREQTTLRPTFSPAHPTARKGSLRTHRSSLPGRGAYQTQVLFPRIHSVDTPKETCGRLRKLVAALDFEWFAILLSDLQMS